MWQVNLAGQGRKSAVASGSSDRPNANHRVSATGPGYSRAPKTSRDSHPNLGLPALTPALAHTCSGENGFGFATCHGACLLQSRRRPLEAPWKPKLLVKIRRGQRGTGRCALDSPENKGSILLFSLSLERGSQWLRIGMSQVQQDSPLPWPMCRMWGLVAQQGV